MPDIPIVTSFLALLQAFSPHFTAPTFRTFLTIASGWVLALGRHTVTATVRAANATRWKHISSFHRFFSKSRWQLDELGLTLVRLIDALIPSAEPLVTALDDTLGRHTGKKSAGASMHRDPLLSTATRTMFHWGHVWVVLGITLRAFALRLDRRARLGRASRARRCAPSEVPLRPPAHAPPLGPRPRR